jgi:hypothetical protein
LFRKENMEKETYELYFWFEGEGDEAIIRPMCVKCHDEKFGYLGWRYDGVLGPWKYDCGKCGETIKGES